MSTPFKVDIDDVEFVFFDQQRAHERLAQVPAYASSRPGYSIAAAFREIKRMAEEVLHPVDRQGDRQGRSLDDQGNVTTPQGHRRRLAAAGRGG